MTCVNKETLLATLNGYLKGIAIVSGNLRDYSAACYVLGSGQFVSSVEATLGRHLKSQIDAFPFESKPLDYPISNVERLDNGLGDLERGIRRYIMRDKLGHSVEQLKDIQHYLSFWIMDSIDPLLEGHEYVDVWKVTAGWEVRETDSVYFCIRMASGMLVLQFTNNIGYKRQRDDSLV